MPAASRPAEAACWPNHWLHGPAPWPGPEEKLLTDEVRAELLDAIASLPPAQREVLVLRDLEGLSGPETCNALGIGDTNQRVLLHRAHSRVRNALERYFDESERT
jgi:RNA polymerase sigma-70 factor, ECF subfamily